MYIRENGIWSMLDVIVIKVFIFCRTEESGGSSAINLCYPLWSAGTPGYNMILSRILPLNEVHSGLRNGKKTGNLQKLALESYFD